MNGAGKIVQFCHVLRGLGVRVSTSEMLDGAEALLAGDWSDSSQIRGALQATLIKRREDIPVFREAFDSFFFALPERVSGEAGSDRSAGRGGADTPDELTFQGRNLNISGDLQQVYRKMAGQDRQRLLSFLEKTSGGYNVGMKFTQVVEKAVTGSLEYWRRQLAAEEEPAFPVRLCGEDAVDRSVVQAAKRLETGRQALLHQDMQRIGERDLPLARSLIKQLAQKLSHRLSRRYHQARSAERLDLRRTIRCSFRYGGVVFQPRYKAAKRTKPRILLLCDISGSMARYAVFVLQFLYGLASHVDNLESFVFAEDVERMTAKFKQRQAFASLMSETMAQSTQWGKGTDLAQSLATLDKEYRKMLHPSTIVLILSDTKTVNSEAAVAGLAALRKKVRNIIWLNTLPGDEWSRHKTTGLFQKHSSMVACNTLNDLARIVGSEIFRIRR